MVTVVTVLDVKTQDVPVLAISQALDFLFQKLCYIAQETIHPTIIAEGFDLAKKEAPGTRS